MKAFILPFIADPIERVFVEDICTFFQRGEVVKQLLSVPRVQSETIDALCRANCMPVLPF